MKNIKYLLGNVFIDPMLKQYYFKYTRLNKIYYQKMNFICFFLFILCFNVIQKFKIMYVAQTLSRGQFCSRGLKKSAV